VLPGEYLAGEVGIQAAATDPALIGTGTEGGTGLFAVEYFDGKVYLTQSPPLYKQTMVAAGRERVFEIGPAYQAEKHDTPRHINEFVSLDVETAWIESEQDLMDLETRTSRQGDRAQGLRDNARGRAHALRLGPDNRGHRGCFVHAYPRKSRPFSTLPAEGNRTHAFDLLFRGLEITSGGMCINRREDIVESATTFGLASVKEASLFPRDRERTRQ
jgi:nondiscriminating aspartyl-tRNA synthetase